MQVPEPSVPLFLHGQGMEAVSEAQTRSNMSWSGPMQSRSQADAPNSCHCSRGSITAIVAAGWYLGCQSACVSAFAAVLHKPQQGARPGRWRRWWPDAEPPPADTLALHPMQAFQGLGRASQLRVLALCGGASGSMSIADGGWLE